MTEEEEADTKLVDEEAIEAIDEACFDVYDFMSFILDEAKVDEERKQEILDEYKEEVQGLIEKMKDAFQVGIGAALMAADQNKYR